MPRSVTVPAQPLATEPLPVNVVDLRCLRTGELIDLHKRGWDVREELVRRGLMWTH